MKKHIALAFLVSLVAALGSTAVFGQAPAESDVYKVVRTKSMEKTADFGPGGTVVILGAPSGSVSVEGWDKHKVSVEAEIVVRATNEEDAARLANVTGFVVNADVTSLRIHSVGVHDKKALKKVDKKFPKRLRQNPFAINYKIKVPYFSDLQIDGGAGSLNLSSIEGFMRVNFLESNAVLRLVGGTVRVTVGRGSVDVTIATRSWRGRDADIQLANGELNLRLPKNLNADLTAQILRTGTTTNTYQNLSPRPRTEFTDTLMNAIAGSGGAKLNFTVGDGSMNILDFEKTAK